EGAVQACRERRCHGAGSLDFARDDQSSMREPSGLKKTELLAPSGAGSRGSDIRDWSGSRAVWRGDRLANLYSRATTKAVYSAVALPPDPIHKSGQPRSEQVGS